MSSSRASLVTPCGASLCARCSRTRSPLRSVLSTVPPFDTDCQGLYRVVGTVKACGAERLGPTPCRRVRRSDQSGRDLLPVMTLSCRERRSSKRTDRSCRQSTHSGTLRRGQICTACPSRQLHYRRFTDTATIVEVWLRFVISQDVSAAPTFRITPLAGTCRCIRSNFLYSTNTPI